MPASTSSCSPPAPPSCATSCSCASRARGTVAGIRGASLLKGRQHADTTLVADHAARGLHQPRSIQVGARRRGPRRLPGQDHRATARAEDRCEDGDARAAALGNRRGRQQAGARNLRRRRAVRSRRDLGRSRRGSAVLPQGARHSGEGGRGAADPGLRRRGGGGDRACRAARRADGRMSPPGSRRGDETCIRQ